MRVTNEGGVVIAEIEGVNLNVGNVKEFKAQIEPYLESESSIILDLNQLMFIDSSGLGAFLSILKRLNKKGGDLRICSITKPVRILFELVRLHQIIDVFDTREEAIASFSPSPA